MPIRTRAVEFLRQARLGNVLFAFAAVALVPLAIVAVRSYDRRTAGQVEVRAATQRVASALERGDRAALEADPLLRGHPGTIAWLVEHRPALSRGYRVAVCRNGEGGYQLLSPEDVSHLGIISTPSGDLRLGFRYDRETGQLEFVTASFS